MDGGVSPQNILLLNFHDNVLAKKDLESLILEYLQAFNPKGKIYVFLDEVQNAKEWESFLRRSYDLNKNYSFFVTSSLKIRSKEFSTLLSGRKKSFVLYPFSFKELVKFKKLDFKYFDEEKKARILHISSEFLFYGGFPEVVKKKYKLELLQEYSEDFLYKDVVEKNRLNPEKTKKLYQWLIENPGRLVSFRKLESMLGISTEAIERYIEALKEAYLFVEVKSYEKSYRSQLIKPKKYYPIDNGLITAESLWGEEKRGYLLESLVLQELIKKGEKEVFYYRNKYEIDFITPSTKIDITFDPDLEREQKEGVEVIDFDKKNPFWKWALKM